MAKTIIKRDNIEVPFDKNKIIDAILKAYHSVEEVDIESDYILAKCGNIADYIEELELSSDTPLTVEQIQDYVCKGLMSLKDKRYATEYIQYRHDRDLARNNRNKTNQIIKEKILASNIQNSNANVDEASFGGRQGEVSNEYLKQFALDNLMSKTARNNHLNNEIYTHDLSSYALGNHNCLTLPIDDLLAKGVKTRQVDIRPAGSINTAFQLLAVYFQIQSLQQFGGVSISHLDWTMVPYVRKSFYKHWIDGLKYVERESDATNYLFYLASYKDSPLKNASIDDKEFKRFNKAYEYAMDMTKKEASQAIEGFLHNANSLQSRSGNQLPFTSINLGTCTLPEGRMIIKLFLKNVIKGVGPLHSTPIFPCSIFQVGEGINKNPGDPNYDMFQLALKCTAQRLYPNYVNMDWSGNEGYDINDPKTYASTMGCRTWTSSDINAEPGQNPQLKDGRGNICPVTIILPTLAMEAKELSDENLDDRYSATNIFMSILDKKIHEAKDQLIERYEYICSQSPASAKFMYENNTFFGYKPEEGIRSALKHGSLGIGQLGLAECLQILIGKDHTTEEGMELAKRIEKLFKDRCAEFKQEYKLNFGVYYTPKFLWGA